MPSSSRYPALLILLSLSMNNSLSPPRPKNYCRFSAASTMPSDPPRFATSTSIDFDVFIEDTDAFGMIYNANYLKLYQRAIETLHGGAQLIVRADRMKYKIPGRMGDKLTVQSTFLRTEGEISVWEQRVLCSGRELNSATTQVPLNTSPRECAVMNDSTDPQCATPPFRVWADECMVGGGIDLVASLRFFERSRTLALGGPASLQRCVGEGAAIVVARVDDLALAPAARTIRPGDLVVVESAVAARGKSLVTFRHRLVALPTRDEPRVVVAEGTAICACVGPDGKGTAFPDWALELLPKTAA